MKTVRHLWTRFAMHGRRWATAMLAACLLLTCWKSRADAAPPAPPTASAAMSQSTVDLGDSLVYQITVEGVTDVKPPTLPPSDGWDAEYMGGRDESMRSTFIVNGRVTESSSLKYVMQWRITPRRLGPTAVDSFTFDVGGKPVRVPRVQFRTNEPQESPNFRLVLESDRTSAYVGEPIRMRLVWSMGANVKSAAFTGPDGDDLFDIEPLDPRPLKARGSELSANHPWRVVPFLGRDTIVTRSQGELGGRAVAVFTLELVVTPRKEGSLAIGPYRAACDEVVGQRARGFFDSPFDDRSQTRRTITTGNSLSLEVRPLPVEGRPEGFSGLIGTYSIEASATNAEANVGDPVPLTIVIRGPEPMPGLVPPDLSLQGDFESTFRPAPEGWEAAPSGAEGQRRFTTTVRPRSDTITQIPPVRLPYFDTSAGRYAVAESAPIALKVRPSRQITAADAAGAGTSFPLAAASAPSSRLTSAPGGIGANTESLDAIEQRHVGILAMIAAPPGLLLLALPPLAAMVAWLAAVRSRGTDQRRAARRAAAARAAASIARATTVADLASAIRDALGPFLSMKPEAITFDDAAKAPLPAEVRQEAASMLERLERDAYGVSAEASLTDLRPRASRLISMLREVA